MPQICRNKKTFFGYFFEPSVSSYRKEIMYNKNFSFLLFDPSKSPQGETFGLYSEELQFLTPLLGRGWGRSKVGINNSDIILFLLLKTPKIIHRRLFFLVYLSNELRV